MKTLWLLILIIGLPVLTAIGLWMLGRTAKRKYDKDMIFLEEFLSKTTPSQHSFDFILSEFERIPDMDRERTGKAWKRFKAIYKPFFEASLISDDFERVIEIQKSVAV